MPATKASSVCHLKVLSNPILTIVQLAVQEIPDQCYVCESYHAVNAWIEQFNIFFATPN